MTNLRIVIGDCSFDATSGDGDVTALVAAWRAAVVEREARRLECVVAEKRRAVEAARRELEDTEADLTRWNGVVDGTTKELTP